MDQFTPSASRRTFLQSTAALAGAAAFGAPGIVDSRAIAAELQADEAAPPRRKLRVAAVNSIYRLRSHAYHICGRFILGYDRHGKHYQPPIEVVRMYNDQYPQDDLSRAHCQKFGIERCDTPEATLGKPGQLDVDGVLIIVEHGDYPLNEFRQILYPRYEMFERVVKVFRETGRAVPVFVDKHLSYDRQHAAKMVAASRELKFPLLAGSSLPVTWRRPEIEPPLETPFTEALCTFGFDRGTPEIYFFHALEVLQSMLERRVGGETGIKSIECLEGDAVWKAGDAGRWSWKLLEAAIATCESNNIGLVRHNVLNPQAILIEYRDGTKGAVLNLIEQVSEFGFAGLIRGRQEPLASCFFLPPPPGARFFDPLCWNIERLLVDGKPPYPVERTWLTSTVLDLAMRSLKAGGQPSSDPTLDIRYSPPRDSGFFRSTAPG